MGSLDQPHGSAVKREIDIFDITGLSIPTIKTNYNNNYGPFGWRIIQIVQLGANTYIIIEREIE